MSQVTQKSQRPTLSLSNQYKNVKQPRSGTPSTTDSKSDSRSSTPTIKNVMDNDGTTPSPKGKRRVSNDSPKVRASPKPVVILLDDDSNEKKEKNGHATNGNSTNGSHVEGNGVATKEEKKETKGNKNDVLNNKSDKEKNGKKEETGKATPDKKSKKQELNTGERSSQEMEKLILEPDTTPAVGSPMPKSTPARVLKYTPGKAGRISPFNKQLTAVERLQNASTIVNLSTVSEQSTESGSAAPSPAVVAADSPVRPPSGRISGRRNTRPIKDIKMIHPAKGANDSNSSVTANLGSPVHHDSLRTPIIAQLIGRKRVGTPEDHDTELCVDSPSKRARLDFSGFLGYVTTPVTLLKSRLSRIGLAASTPRALDTEENIADVSGMETEEVAEDAAAKINNDDVSQAKEASESVMENEIEDLKGDNAEKSTDSVETETPTPERRQSVCNIM